MAFPVPREVNPTSLPLPHPDAYEGEPREFARALMQRKDDIEKEIVSRLVLLCCIEDADGLGYAERRLGNCQSSWSRYRL